METAAELKTIRTDHTGALRRPEWLRQLYVDHYEGKVDDGALADGQARAITEVIVKQEEVGFRSVTDGEFRRFGGFQQSFGGAVSGFDALPYVPSISSIYEARPGAPQRIESGVSGPGVAIGHRLPVKHRLELVHNLIGEEYAFASTVASRPVKLTLIGPDRISQRFEYESSRDVYSGMDEFLADVIAIERQMISEAVAAGCRYIQIDEPGYTAYVDQPLLERMRARGEDPRENMRRSIRANNDIIAGFPGVTFAIHICRGGGGGRGGPGWHREGSYDAIAEELFNELNFHRFLLEYDSEAAGTFEPLRFMPRDKTAVLGLLSNHGEAESVDYVKQRLDEASRFLPVDQLAICPRCGMSNISSEDEQWAKFRVLHSVAADVWGG